MPKTNNLKFEIVHFSLNKINLASESESDLEHFRKMISGFFKLATLTATSQ